MPLVCDLTTVSCRWSAESGRTVLGGSDGDPVLGAVFWSCCRCLVSLSAAHELLESRDLMWCMAVCPARPSRSKTPTTLNQSGTHR